MTQLAAEYLRVAGRRLKSDVGDISLSQFFAAQPGFVLDIGKSSSDISVSVAKGHKTAAAGVQGAATGPTVPYSVTAAPVATPAGALDVEFRPVVIYILFAFYCDVWSCFDACLCLSVGACFCSLLRVMRA